MLYSAFKYNTLNFEFEKWTNNEHQDFQCEFDAFWWLLKIISKKRCGGSLFGVRHKISHQGFTTASLFNRPWFCKRNSPHRFLGKCKTCELLNDSMPAHERMPDNKLLRTQRQWRTLNDAELSFVSDSGDQKLNLLLYLKKLANEELVQTASWWLSSQAYPQVRIPFTGCS